MALSVPELHVQVAGRSVRLTKPDRLLWTDPPFRKTDLVAYVEAIAPVLLPHLAGRAVTLARFPEGIDGPGWYQTNCPPGRPEWMRVARVEGREGKALTYCLFDDAAALVWAANLGAIELHPFLAAADRPGAPRALVFDLDPGAPAGVIECCRVALAIRVLLARDGLRAFPKTSGAKGLHVYVPLDGSADFSRTKAYARSVASTLAAGDPALVLDRMARSERAGRVFVDWGQNDASKSTVAPYSMRAAPVPSVSTPLAWDEVEAAVRARDPRLLWFGPEQVLARVARVGDLFRPVLDEPQALRV